MLVGHFEFFLANEMPRDMLWGMLELASWARLQLTFWSDGRHVDGGDLVLLFQSSMGRLLGVFGVNSVVCSLCRCCVCLDEAV